MTDLAADMAAPEDATLAVPSGKRRRRITSEQVLRMRVQELHLQPDATTSAATEEDLMNDTCWCGKKYPCLDH